MFFSKSENVKSESEEEPEIKSDITVGVCVPKEKQKVKRKLPTEGDQSKKVKNNIKKKKSLSHNWNVSDI